MILPLLCASLIASAAVAPSGLPLKEDYTNTFVNSLVRKNRIVTDQDVQLDELPTVGGYYIFYFSFPSASYFEVNSGDFVDADWGSLTISPRVSFYPNGYDVSIEYNSVSDGVLTLGVRADFSTLPSFDNAIFSFTLNCTSGGESYEFDCNIETSAFLYDGVLVLDPNIDHDDSDFNYLIVPSSSVDGVEVVGEIVSILGAGIGQLGAAIGSGVSSFASSLAFDGNGNMSIYLIMVIALAGVALACGLTAKLFNWLTSLGN